MTGIWEGEFSFTRRLRFGGYKSNVEILLFSFNLWIMVLYKKDLVYIKYLKDSRKVFTG